MRQIERFWYFCRPYKGPIALILIITPITAFFEYVNVAVFFNLANIVLGQGASLERSSNIFKYIHKLIDIVPANDMLLSAIIILISTSLAKSLGLTLATYLNSYFSQRVRIDLQFRLSERYLMAPYRFFVQNKQGSLLFNVTQAPQTVASVLKVFPNIFIGIIRISFLMLLLFMVSVKVTIVVCAIGILFLSITAYFSKRVGYLAGAKTQESLSDTNVAVNEFISGIKIVKAYLMETRFAQIIKNHSRTFIKAKMKFEGYRTMLTNSLEFILMSVFAILVMALKGAYSDSFINLLPSMVVYMLAFYKIIPILNALGNQRLEYMHDFPTLELLMNELTNEESVPEEDGDCDISRIGRIIFENVDFNYGSKEVLKRASFSIEPRKVTAIIGRSGAGKTTIVNLLLKLYRADRGTITVNGVNINNLSRSSYLARIAYVSQDPILFNESIRTNIFFGREGKADEKKMSEIVHQAHIDEFIDRLPLGLDTKIGDMGARLSGGQRQRICLARALYRDPELIILDEAISSLDNISQSFILNSVEKLSHQKTFLIIAHKLSTVEKADKIVVLDNGSTVEQGSHSELLSKKNLYYQMREEGFK